ncbi:MAG: hypothetical protein J6B16_04135 [Clostridia bacterium]|nr:hypothetical protein [Clostridia bacterium]
MKKIIVSDITLKAIKEQDLSLTFREKLAISESLDKAKVDSICLPCLSNSKEDEVIYRTIASSINNATVMIEVGACEDGVKTASECVKNSLKSGLQVAMPVSTAQMEYFYHAKAPVMLGKIKELIEKSVNLYETVEFVAKDAFRAEAGFLVSAIKTACDAGASAVTIFDDNGEAFPEDFYNVVKEVKDACDIKVFVCPSDKFKMATACAIQAIKAGADGVITSMVGDYLKTDVLADVFRAKKFDLDAFIDVDVTNVKSISQAIASITDKAVLEEISGDVSVGFIDSSANLKDVATVVKQLGYELSDTDLGNIYDEVKKLLNGKETIDIKELEAIIASSAMQVPSTYHLINYVVTSSNVIPATANVTLEKCGERFTGVSTGDGPIDASFHAIEQVIGHHYELDDFQVHAVTKGREAVGSSIIRLRADGKLYPGNGVSTDIVGACIRAYINAINKIVHEGNK